MLSASCKLQHIVPLLQMHANAKDLLNAVLRLSEGLHNLF